MARRLSDLKNLEKATEIKRSGFKTKVHASPHKDEIDEWIIERRWSSRMIANELKRLYPNEDHPSARTIDNYRRKYLPKEYHKAVKSTLYPEELRKKLAKQFDPAMEGIKLWSLVTQMIESANKTLGKTSIVPKFAIDLVKASADVYKTICEEFARLGIIKEVPPEIQITEKKMYDPEEFKRKVEKFVLLQKEIERIKKVEKGASGELGETISEGEVSGEHGTND